MFHITGSDQAVFDTAVGHLANQKHRSTGDNGVCRYRGVRGEKCAFGIFIPEDQNEESMEGLACDNTLKFNWSSDASRHLFFDIQDAHDSSNTLYTLKHILMSIAERYSLDAYKINLITEWEGTYV